VLPEDFDWWRILSRDQVHLIRNEYGPKDFWANFTGHLVAGTGHSGSTGFLLDHYSIEQKEYKEHTHSDYFKRDHMKDTWLPFLRRRISRLATKHGQSLNSKTFNRYFRASMKIDSEYFGALEYHSVVAPSIDLAKRWIGVNPDIYTFLTDRGGDLPVGYINAIPAAPRLLDKIKRGVARDNEITEEDILPYTADSVISIYCLSIAIRKAPAGSTLGFVVEGLHKLLNAFCSKLLLLAQERRIFVSDLYADAWTAEGIQICEMLGMQSIRKDEFGHPIYHLDLKNISPRAHCSSVKYLAAYYRANVSWAPERSSGVIL
jgi:hypothetical protein